MGHIHFLNFSVSWNKYKVKMSKFSYLMVFSLFFNLLHLCNIARQRVLNGQFFKWAHILNLYIFTAKQHRRLYLFKVNNTITKTRSVICSKFTMETPKYCFSVLIVNFQQISHFLFMCLFVQFEQVIAGKECLYFKCNFQLQLMVK